MTLAILSLVIFFIGFVLSLNVDQSSKRTFVTASIVSLGVLLGIIDTWANSIRYSNIAVICDSSNLLFVYVLWRSYFIKREHETREMIAADLTKWKVEIEDKA